MTCLPQCFPKTMNLILNHLKLLLSAQIPSICLFTCRLLYFMVNVIVFMTEMESIIYITIKSMPCLQFYFWKWKKYLSELMIYKSTWERHDSHNSFLSTNAHFPVLHVSCSIHSRASPGQPLYDMISGMPQKCRTGEEELGGGAVDMKNEKKSSPGSNESLTNEDQKCRYL